MSFVAYARNESNSLDNYRAALAALFELMDGGFLARFRNSARVLVKPFLKNGTVCDPEMHITTHPMLLIALIELLKDCGSNVSFGGGGMDLMDGRRPQGLRWIDDVSKRTGAPFVSFPGSGGVLVPSRVHNGPRNYGIARALLETDVVVSCSNLAPHATLGVSGTIKNMFNAVIGHQQDDIARRFGGSRKYAEIIADVCSIVKPYLSILDLTKVRGCTAAQDSIEPVGIVLGGDDPVAIDSVAATTVNFKNSVRTSYFAEKFDIGTTNSCDIDFKPHQYHSRVVEGDRRTEKRSGKATSFRFGGMKVLSKHVAHIDEVLCEKCGRCVDVCFARAIKVGARDTVRVDPTACVSCLLCQSVCESGAVTLTDGGPVMQALTPAWTRAKNGFHLRVGKLRVNVHCRQEKPLREAPVRGAPLREAPGYESRTEVGPRHPKPGRTSQEPRDVAIIVGVGSRLGSALVRRFSQELEIVAVARDTAKLRPLAEEVNERNGRCTLMSCDATDHRSVQRLFETVVATIGRPRMVAYNIEHFIPGSVVDVEPAAFDDCWRANCYGGFLVSRQAARTMLSSGQGRGRGTIIFGGATASLRGRERYVNLAVGKFGLRALSQSMARELGPRGIHVAHVILDGGMRAMGPDAVAEIYHQLYRQPPTTWSQEIDVRRFDEKW